MSDTFIDLGDRRLRVRRLEPSKTDGLDRTTLVFLHEGLGCIEMWRDFPQTLCDVLQCRGVIYDRKGRELARTGWSPAIVGDWDISPDGSQVAIPNHDPRDRFH